jgi:hypothetical protein
VGAGVGAGAGAAVGAGATVGAGPLAGADVGSGPASGVGAGAGVGAAAGNGEAGAALVAGVLTTGATVPVVVLVGDSRAVAMVVDVMVVDGLVATWAPVVGGVVGLPDSSTCTTRCTVSSVVVGVAASAWFASAV